MGTGVAKHFAWCNSNIHYETSIHFQPSQVEFRGGDKSDDQLKKADDPQLTAFADALQELLKAIAVVHARGKLPSDFEPQAN